MALHDGAAARRFPGPDFYAVLEWIHDALNPETYVEIGVLNGDSLRLAQPPTIAVGIDPNAVWEGVRIFRLSSSEFFAHHDLRKVLGGRSVDFALVDGLHVFEQAIDDLFNLERYAGPGTVIALHDTIPLDRETSARNRRTEFYTGDVWKVLPFLRSYRPDLEMITVATAPTGLTLIRHCDCERDNTSILERIAEFAGLDFDYFERHCTEFLALMPNERSVVQAFCQYTPVQSIVRSGAVIPSR